MRIVRHELRRGWFPLLMWAGAVSGMLGIAVLVYPEMTSQIEQINDMFAQMGSFTAAFGMDKINFGEFIGYFGVECGNVLGLGGGMFAALVGIGMLAKETKDHTADFLFTHPLSRGRIWGEKLLATFLQILLLSLAAAAAATAATLLIGQRPDWGTAALILLSYLLMQLLIGTAAFGLSALIRGSGLGIGLGMALALYFLHILSNITDSLSWLKYLTPYSFTDAAAIISDGAIPAGYCLSFALIALLTAAAGFCRFRRKDL